MQINKVTTSDLKALPLTNLFTITGSSPDGLKTEEAIQRSKLFGYNEFKAAKKVSSIILFLGYFKKSPNYHSYRCGFNLWNDRRT